MEKYTAVSLFQKNVLVFFLKLQRSLVGQQWVSFQQAN